MHRDPETGQFVGGSDVSEAYDDLEWMSVTTNYEIDAAQADGTEENPVENARTLEPAGGIDRGEYAELVMLEFRWLASVEGTQSAEGSTFQRFEISDSARSHHVLNSSKDNSTLNQPLLDSDVQGGVFAYDGGDRVFYHGQNVGEGSFMDTASAVAGGADVGFVHVVRNFRGSFGMGPIFDRNDRIHEHLSLDLVDVSDASAEMDISYDLVWDVHEGSDL